MDVTVFFGLSFDDRVAHSGKETSGGRFYVGPEKLMRLFEKWLGLVHPNRDIEHLRIEQYRQALLAFKEENPEVFYAASFDVSQFATSHELLKRRDELLLAGWDFSLKDGLPSRLKVLALIEASVDQQYPEINKGFADRFRNVLNVLEDYRLPIVDFWHHEPEELLPGYLRNLFWKLKKKGVSVRRIASPDLSGDSDLAVFRRSLESQQPGKASLSADKSLIIIKGKTESSMATWLANLLRNNQDFRPMCLVPGKSGTLDNAFIQEGLPGMGMQSASLARPSLQILKLLPAFLWKPTDPFKILEFVSLAVKPLEEELSRRIAEQISEKPGIDGDGWRFMIRQYFTELEEKGHNGIKSIRSQYQMWFGRHRYDANQKVPKTEVLELYSYLRDWALDIFEEQGGGNPTLIVLSEQARRICELVEAQPEAELTNLQLEYIVRTIYQPAPLQIQQEQEGRLDFVRLPGTVHRDTDQLLWWNFTQNEQEHFFSPWYKHENRWLSNNGIDLHAASDKNALLLWHRKQPVLRTREQLILVVPEIYEGSEVHPHPLLGNLEALFGDLSPITVNLDQAKGLETIKDSFNLPGKVKLDKRRVGEKKAFLHLKSDALAQQREKETITGLESLFYYPYKWAFQYKAKLRKSPILSVVSDNRLLGNLAHRFFEILFENPSAIEGMNKAAVERKVDEEMAKLLVREGAVLLLYGREPERLAFINKLKYAAWSLVTMVRSNGWTVVQTEKELEGEFVGTEVKGRADLVLEKDGSSAIVDIKWRGSSRRERELKNEEDLQLVLYAKLLPPEQDLAQTAYFVIENGKMIARNDSAFKEAVTVSPEADLAGVNKRILDRMEATMKWRMEQLKQGILEIRCRHTLAELEEAYGEEQLEILEMKDRDAPFDDYKVLIGLVE
ncbi:MAG: PD-(D/E)XK nuclease family protein [Bacteroidetes bacterium]|nr:MAG: PD-(D/E)XK nuclease family protein [Bacteroidota bacterium]